MLLLEEASRDWRLLLRGELPALEARLALSWLRLSLVERLRDRDFGDEDGLDRVAMDLSCECAANAAIPRCNAHAIRQAHAAGAAR